MKRKITIVAITTVLALTSTLQAHDSFDYSSKKPLSNKSILITLKSANPSALEMGMHLGLSAVKKGADANIFIGAGTLPYVLKLNNKRPITKEFHTLNMKKLNTKKVEIQNKIKKFMKLGGTVYVCAYCVKKAGKKAGDFIKNIKIVHSKKYYELLFYKTDKNLEF